MGEVVYVSVSSLASRPNTDLTMFSKQSQCTLISLVLSIFFPLLYVHIFSHPMQHSLSFIRLSFSRLILGAWVRAHTHTWSHIFRATEKGSNDLISHLSSHTSCTYTLSLLLALFLASFLFFSFLLSFTASTRNRHIYSTVILDNDMSSDGKMKWSNNMFWIHFNLILFNSSTLYTPFIRFSKLRALIADKTTISSVFP